MRGSTLLAGATITGMILGVLLVGIHSHMTRRESLHAARMKTAMVAALGITDLCLFTEAPYTRHPALADRHSPLMPHPMTLERFPSGALRPPPHRFRQVRHGLD